ncbi:MAG: outer membrane beta-barrel protein [Bacteroidales bacterium]|nr:outer membrane beta-barrel protein [Bacteroidales bacterium]
MKEYKDIDRLFQEKFRDFEQNPSNKVWKNIENSLAGKPERNRKAVWLWFSGVAASLALLFLLNSPIFKVGNVQENTTDTEKIISNTNNSTQSEIVETPINETHLKQTDKLQDNNHIANNPVNHPETTTSKQIINTNQKITPSTTPTNHLASTTKKEIPKTTKKTILATTTQQKAINNSIPQTLPIPKSLIAQSGLKLQKEIVPEIKIISSKKELASTSDKSLTENTIEIDNTASNKKWSISTVVAPVYLSAFNKARSSIDKQFDNNVKQGNFSAAYGVQVAYQLSNRFSVQSGLHVIDYGYKTYGVFVSPSGAVSRYSNINYDGDSNLINVNAAPSIVQYNVLNETDIQESKGDLTQVFGYLEIPIEAKYRLNKGNLGINLIGGFSTLLLNKNEIFIETDDFSNKLGEASNLNALNFSGNLGLELEYKLYKNVNFNLVPMFKVQTNTFEKNSGGFSPYAIGVYSGLNLRF